MFDLKAPCGNCPFRRDKAHLFGLSEDRVREIVSAQSFQCHKTVDYGEFDDPDKRQGDNPQQCAGLMAMLHAEGRPNQIMQVAERLGVFDPTALDTSKTFATVSEAMEAHGNGNRTPSQRRNRTGAASPPDHIP